MDISADSKPYNKRNSLENKKLDSYTPTLLVPPIDQIQPHVYLLLLLLLYIRLKVKVQDSYHNRSRKERVNIQYLNQLKIMKTRKKLNIFIIQLHLQQYIFLLLIIS